MNHDIIKYQQHMPESARHLCDLIGLKSTIILVRQFGGVSMFISPNPTAPSQQYIASFIGEQAARLFCTYAGNTEFTIPTCCKALKIMRNDEIRAEYDRLTLQLNLSSRDAVRTLTKFTNPHLHERSIWRILNKADG